MILEAAEGNHLNCLKKKYIYFDIFSNRKICWKIFLKFIIIYKEKVKNVINSNILIYGELKYLTKSSKVS